MRFRTCVLSAWLAIWLTLPVFAEELYRSDRSGQEYPVYLTEPFAMVEKSQDFYRQFFANLSVLVSKKENGQKILPIALRVLKNSDGRDIAICGSGLIGELGPVPRKEILFAYTHDTVYSGFDWRTWRKLGCQTRGGTFITSKVQNIGSTDVVFEASQDVDGKDGLRPAVSPGAPLRLGVRQRIAAGFEDELSQLLGGQVHLISDREYKEQDGTSTSCTIAAMGNKEFRIAHPGWGRMKINPTETDWIAAGCTRPGYQLIR